MYTKSYSRAFMVAWVIVTTGCVEEVTTTTPAEISVATRTPLADLEPTLSSVFPTSTPGLNQRGESINPSISPDGRYVAFASNAGDLTEKSLPRCTYTNETHTNCTGIFIYDRQMHMLEMVSVSSDGQPANASSTQPSISADGRWVIFQSQATNLDGNPAKADWGLFIHDRLTGVNQMLNVSGRDPDISGGSRFAAYQALSQEGWHVLLYDQQTQQTRIVSTPLEGNPIDEDFSILPLLSPGGHWLAFWSWANTLTKDDDPLCSKNCGDVFLYDLDSGRLERIEVGEDMGEGMTFYPLSFSADEHWLAFRDLIYDLRNRQSMSLCVKDEDCRGGILSGDGQWVAYAKEADVFIQNRLNGEQKQASITNTGIPGNGEVIYCHDAGLWCATFPEFDLSHDGRWVVFSTTASNLDSQDDQLCGGEDIPLHNCRDIYLHDFETGVTTWISRPHTE